MEQVLGDLGLLLQPAQVLLEVGGVGEQILDVFDQGADLVGGTRQPYVQYGPGHLLDVVGGNHLIWRMRRKQTM